ncbi:MAG: hypothetical protein Q7R73_05115 [bacterium]|nr:hypothetical protein [bacterium]
MKKVSFKPFLVESDYEHKNHFRIVELDTEITKAQAAKFLEKLPICFDVALSHNDPKELSATSVDEPLEVHVSSQIVSIYPPKERFLSSAAFRSGCTALTRRMDVDNLFYSANPGDTQIRSCVHFNPSVLGVRGWPASAGEKEREVEVDIYRYPYGKSNYTPRPFPRIDIEDLLELIAGGENASLSVERLEKWKDLVKYAVTKMRECYTKEKNPEKGSVEEYYQECWQKIDAAKDDEKKMVAALEFLRESIKWK